MAGYRRQNTDGPNSEDKTLDLFAEMMIEKLENISKDWKKPWFTEGSLQWPRNLSGREYNGMNEGIGTERREIVSRHADHIYLHPQGDQGEDQV